MVHGWLRAGLESSGKLVSCIRREARALAQRESLELLICDGPPGIGSPVAASITGADLVLILVEPAASAIRDFERAVELAKHCRVPAAACVNKSDLNKPLADRLEERAAQLGVPVTGRIPYDDAVDRAQLSQQSVVEYTDDGVSAAIRDVWQGVQAQLNAGGAPSG
jgi:MinD superfamily P-loop ATPase